jgi:putative ABC transport system substrate-binding protein
MEPSTAPTTNSAQSRKRNTKGEKTQARRVGDQSESGKADRFDDSIKCAGAAGQSVPMTVASWQWSVVSNNLWKKLMAKSFLVWLLTTVLLRTVSPAEAQQPRKIYRIGYLSPVSPSSESARSEALRQGLRELGYIEQQNIFIEYRYAQGKLDQLPALAGDLVRLKVDVIVTATTPGILAAKKTTETIPIVFAVAGDPVRGGLVTSLARPGGNITGLSIFSGELDGKRLELLKETFPKVTRVAYLWDPSTPGTGLRGMQAAAPALGLQLQSLEVRSANDFDSAFEAVLRERAHAITAAAHPVIGTHRKRIVDFAAKNRLPAIHAESEFVDAGGLMFYGVNFADLYRRAATYVDKILKGAKPADLPVEQPKKFEFIINLKAAKQIGLTIPPKVLAPADRVIR